MPPSHRHAQNPGVFFHSRQAREIPENPGFFENVLGLFLKNDNAGLKMFKKRLPRGPDFPKRQKD
jgi:hypothetical protein